MPKMTRLHDPVSIEINQDWALVVSSAGLYGDGTRADIHLYNGTIQAANLVRLSLEDARKAISEEFAQIAQADVALIASILLEAKDQVEALLRMADEEGSPKAELFGARASVTNTL